MSVEKLDFSYVRQAKKSFTTHLNEVLQNIKCGFTLGVYCYLSSLPHDWVVNKNHLMKHFDVGRDKIKNAMSWLNSNHLIEYEQDRESDGKMGKSLIIVKDGTDFIKNFVNKQEHDTGGLKNRPTVNLTGGLKNRRTVKPLDGKTAPTYINIKDTKTNKERERQKLRAEKDRTPLSQDFKIDEDNQKLLQEASQKSGRSENDLMVKFKSLMKTKELEVSKWQDELTRFLINERPSANHGNMIKNIPSNNELRSTIKEWGPGHPDFDRLSSYKRPARI